MNQVLIHFGNKAMIVVRSLIFLNVRLLAIEGTR